MSVMPEPGPGGQGARVAIVSPIFSRSVNPILIGGGQIMPTNYHWPPHQSFSPSGITVYLVISVRLWNFKDGGSLKARFLSKINILKGNFDTNYFKLLMILSS